MTRPKKSIESFTGTGLNDNEKKFGQKLYLNYKKNYPQFNKPSNLQLLEELVWLECMQDRYKKQIGEITKATLQPNGKIKTEQIPKHLQQATNDTLNQILSLKTKLNLFDDQKVTDAFRKLEIVMEKAQAYRKANPLQFKTTCPKCSQIFYLKRKTEGYKPFISPFYADDKVLKNDELHACWKEGILPKERYAKALGVSPDYIDWLDENIYKNKKKSD